MKPNFTPTYSHVRNGESRWASVQRYLSLGNRQMTQYLNCCDVKQNGAVRSSRKYYTAVARLGAIVGVLWVFSAFYYLESCGLNTLDDKLSVSTRFRSPWKPVRRPCATHSGCLNFRFPRWSRSCWHLDPLSNLYVAVCMYSGPDIHCTCVHVLTRFTTLYALQLYSTNQIETL